MMSTDTRVSRYVVSMSELAFCAGTTQVVVRELLEYDLIVPVHTQPEPVFEATTVPRIHKILRLHHELDVDFSAMGLVLDLLDRIHRLEGELNDTGR